MPKDFAQDFAQLFTGIRIQCAECHNHPFDRWTMDDYYGLVSCFTGVTRKPGSEPREFYIYNDASAPPAKHLLDDRPVPARVLGGLTSGAEAGQDPRVALADWLTGADNPYFARNLANRIWAHFLGRGIIEPVDDLRVSNPPSNGELMDGLAEHLTDPGSTSAPAWPATSARRGPIRRRSSPTRPTPTTTASSPTPASAGSAPT